MPLPCEPMLRAHSRTLACPQLRTLREALGFDLAPISTLHVLVRLRLHHTIFSWLLQMIWNGPHNLACAAACPAWSQCALPPVSNTL